MTEQEIQVKAGVWRLVHQLGFTEALKRLGGDGSESRALLPETRSGVGDNATTIHGSEAPLPDQGTGSHPQRSDLAAYAEWFQSDEGYSSLKRLLVLVDNDDWPEVAKVFIAGRLSQRAEGEPRPQSEEERDEWCPCCGSANVRTDPGPMLICDDCNCQWDAGSRKERSVSGNDRAVASAAPDADPN